MAIRETSEQLMEVQICLFRPFDQKMEKREFFLEVSNEYGKATYNLILNKDFGTTLNSIGAMLTISILVLLLVIIIASIFLKRYFFSEFFLIF